MSGLHGLINLHKPVGITSARVLYQVRRIVGQRKSGHAGTLDPAAEGVLVLCLGQATKLTERIMDQPKTYRARARLDVTSESYDADRPLVDVPVEAPPSPDKLMQALARFEGTIQQVPPAVSAVKIGGRPAYKLQRQGHLPQLKARPATIYWLCLHKYEWPEVDFEMACGRGTYVRALIRDLGKALGTGGCLTALVRTAVGPFHLAHAWSPDRLAAAGADEFLVNLERARALVAGRVPPPPRPSPPQ